ncbi:hypothetical protein CBS101457_003791 [Exobasidium rhododendri]|nr:hypothetical protein CBS101457_003791 [Exobasidium rhododendri]
MPAIPASLEQHTGDVEVLITGFGPFMGYTRNPAWLSTKNLHDTYMSTEQAPLPTEKNASPLLPLSPKSSPRIHIQAIQSSVAYSHVLSLIPRIHAMQPSNPEAREFLDPYGDLAEPSTNIGPQGNGSPFPKGYPVKLPEKGTFDLVVHVGVGAKGGIVVEKVGHKRGYQIPDVKKELAPIATDQSYTTRKEQRASPIRGFGEGYEEFQDEETNSVDVSALVEWLKTECRLSHVRESHDAGRYLCDYIFYCSLCEAKRKGAGTKVQFIHVPPTDEPQSTKECQDTIQSIIWWLVCRDGVQ